MPCSQALGLSRPAVRTGLGDLVLDKPRIGDAGLVHLRDLTELEQGLGLFARPESRTLGCPTWRDCESCGRLTLIGAGHLQADIEN